MNGTTENTLGSVGALSPTSVSAAEALSHFKSITSTALRFNQHELEQEQDMGAESKFGGRREVHINKKYFMILYMILRDIS